MRKDLALHLLTFAIFFLIITVLKMAFTPAFILFWIGGFIGTIAPDIDHFIYALFMRPQELTSQRTQSLLSKREVFKAWNLLLATKNERQKLIFHSAWFQLLFLVVTYWVISSSFNLFGRGFVIAFGLHLVVDQFIDLSTIGNIDNWLTNLPLRFTKEKATLYCLAALLVIFFLAVIF